MDRLLGRALVRCVEDPKIVARWCLRGESEAVFESPLEAQLFGSSPTHVHHASAFLYCLRDVWVVGKEGWPFVGPRAVFAVCPSVRAQASDRMRRPTPAFATRVAGPVFHLTGPNAGNRAHFLVEQLPRLVASLPLLREHAPDFRVLLVPRRSGWQLPLLRKLGVEEDRCIEASKGTLLCERLYYAPMLSSERRQILAAPRDYLAIKAMVERNTPRDGPRDRPAVFLSRRDAPDRRLSNEEALIALLRERWPDLMVVCLGGLTLDEQVNLFRRARLVIGPHGQPFRNALYAGDCLLVQLTYGERSPTAEVTWPDVFSLLGSLAGNRAVTLYSGTQPDSSGNWAYPAPRLREQLDRLDRALAALPPGVTSRSE